MSEFKYTVGLHDLPEEDKTLYVDPENRARLLSVMSKGFMQDGGSPKVKLENGEIMEGVGADLVFGLRQVIIRLLASYKITQAQLEATKH